MEINDVKDRGAPKINNGENMLASDATKNNEDESTGYHEPPPDPDTTQERETSKANDEHDPLVPSVSSAQGSKDPGQTRRDRLKALQSERQDTVKPPQDAPEYETNMRPPQDEPTGPNKPPERPQSMEAVEQRELLEFLRGMVERDRHRREQLKVIKGFLDDPVTFGLQSESLPTSSTPEEIAKRRQEIEYRIRLLSSLLEIYQGELDLLAMAEKHNNGDQSSS